MSVTNRETLNKSWSSGYGRSSGPGLVVMGGDSCSKVMGSNPSTVYWMDIFHIYLYIKIVKFI